MIPIKLISNECCKLADEFVLELIDTLTSEMNPQMVCSVAGLCNNAHIDKLLEDDGLEGVKAVKTTEDSDLVKDISTENKMNSCQGCYKVVGIIENKFDRMTKDQILQSLLQVSGKLQLPNSNFG